MYAEEEEEEEEEERVGGESSDSSRGEKRGEEGGKVSVEEEEVEEEEGGASLALAALTSRCRWPECEARLSEREPRKAGGAKACAGAKDMTAGGGRWRPRELVELEVSKWIGGSKNDPPREQSQTGLALLFWW